ncbi:hypothetical protein QQS21_002819 [Conoideocrella luteorostrata]|uniref:Major facilitator superfamily (MFS) profile domain-containing protein n=1 Tax=Conoideocrella luteorostrata TaxID=1105319 RepID=A0AAJ0CXE4_9HYPO|nr:hypothetical protein QQS21_002819 [Conoideocrella luteorostrata]
MSDDGLDAKYNSRRRSAKPLPELPKDDVSTYDTASTKAMDAFDLPSRTSTLEFDNTAQRIHLGLVTEKEMTFLDCCRKYPTAVFWSLMLSLTVVMEAYDKSLVASFLAFPAFKRAYGQTIISPKGSLDGVEREIMSEWQIGLLNVAVITEIFGLLAHGYLTFAIGYRKVMMGSLVWLCLAIFPAFFAPNIYVLIVSQALAGIPWGVIQTLAATYAAEVVPSGLRAYVLSNINMCWVLGQLFSTGILRALINNNTELAYRLPFGLQWVWVVLLFMIIYFAPDSPWWFIRHERSDEARAALRRLSKRSTLDIENTIALMEHTNNMERKLNYGGATYMDLFRGPNRRRTEIACMVWVCQALSGAVLTSYGAYFFQQAGFDPSKSFTLSTGMYGLAIVGCMLSWILMHKIGRRTLYIAGLAMAVVFLTVGGAFSAALRNSAVSNWTSGAMILLATFTYDLTLGPICYVVVAEVPSTRLRVKTVALARVSYNIITIVNNIIVPKMLNSTDWNISGKACLVYAGTALACLTWCIFRLPETKGLTYLELDILFEKRAPARKFCQVQRRLADLGYPFLSAPEQQRGTSWHGWLAYS